MQRKEQKVILLEDLPGQDEYQMAQPKVRTSSRRSGSKLWEEPDLRRSQGQRRPRRLRENQGDLDNEGKTAIRSSADTSESERFQATPRANPTTMNKTFNMMHGWPQW